MKMSEFCLMLILLFSLVIIQPKYPIFITGGGFCKEAWSDFAHLSKGKVLVLTANQLNIPDEIVDYCQFEVMEVNSREKAENVDIGKLSKATGIYITGGDQADYHRFWRNSRLTKTLDSLWGKIPILTSSASSMVLGGRYFAALDGTMSSTNLKECEIESKMFNISGLEKILIDTHYTERGREGRLKHFLNCCNSRSVLGIGIDESCYFSYYFNGKIRGKGVHLVSQSVY